MNVLYVRLLVASTQEWDVAGQKHLKMDMPMFPVLMLAAVLATGVAVVTHSVEQGR